MKKAAIRNFSNLNLYSGEWRNERMSAKLENPFAMAFISKKYLKEDLADVHFTFADDRYREMVPAHKFLLALASPVFQAMFYGPLKEGDIVKITDSNSDAFKEFLQFVYLPEVNLTMENLEKVLYLVEKYDMMDCFDTLVPLIRNNLTVESMIIGYELAIKFNNSELKTFCERLIQLFTKDMLKSDAFLQCTHDVVKNILQQDVLQCSEIDLFEACIEWAKSECQRKRMDRNNPDNLKTQLGDCFHLIRFGAMDKRGISDILSNQVYKKLFTPDELIEIMQKQLNSLFYSKIFKSVSRSNALTDKKLCCYLKIDRQTHRQTRYEFEKRESTWFSTNEPIILENIKFCDVRQDSMFHNRNDEFVESLEIIEYKSNTIAHDAPSKVLYKSRSSYNSVSEFSHGEESTPLIIIHPKKMYEIRLIFTQDVIQSRHLYHNFEWSFTDVCVKNKITIKFHPSHQKAGHGVVAGLEFYPL